MFRHLRCGACSALSVLFLSLTGPAAADADLVERGRYLVSIMDCTGCHTPGALAGQPDMTRFLSGSPIGFGGPFGTVYPSNLTPDVETGLGSWTDGEILGAVRTGRRPDGRGLSPIMPWPSYAALTEDDGRALVAYLRSLPPVHQQVPAPVPAGETPEMPYLGLMNMH